MELTEINTGNFAKLCHVTKKTLYFYDEIGLLKPIRVAKNGYRFYDVMQCDKMATIKMLQELGASLDEIQSFFRKDVLVEQAEFMREKRLALDEKMKLLEKRKCELDFLIKRINEFIKIGAGTVFFETNEAKRYGIVDQKLKKHFVVNSIELGMQYGVIIDEENLKPAAIFYRDDAGEFIKEAGEYVCMFQTLEDGRLKIWLKLRQSFKSSADRALFIMKIMPIRFRKQTENTLSSFRKKEVPEIKAFCVCMI